MTLFTTISVSLPLGSVRHTPHHPLWSCLPSHMHILAPQGYVIHLSHSLCLSVSHSCLSENMHWLLRLLGFDLVVFACGSSLNTTWLCMGDYFHD